MLADVDYHTKSPFYSKERKVQDRVTQKADHFPFGVISRYPYPTEEPHIPETTVPDRGLEHWLLT